MDKEQSPSYIAILPPRTLWNDSYVSMSCSQAELFMAHLRSIKLALPMGDKQVAGGMGCGQHVVPYSWSSGYVDDHQVIMRDMWEPIVQWRYLAK